jgi:hypothetical protein
VRRAAIAVMGLHVAYGVALLAVPDRLTRSWLGPAVTGDPVKVALRSVAGREVVWHALGILAAVDDRPLRPWLAASLLGDLNDVAATVLGRSGLPSGSSAKTAAAAGGSAAVTAVVLAFS